MKQESPAGSFRLPAVWPQPADAAAAERLCDQFAALGPADSRFARDSATLLRCLGGNSPYLAELALREAAILRRLARDGPDATVAAVMARLARIPPAASRTAVAAAMRQAKRGVALAVSVADLGRLWTLERITAALSELAEATLRLAVGHLLLAGHDSGALRLPDPAEPSRGSGFTVLGMGKLGARELNYSSDIDLILLYDSDSPVYHGDAAGAFFTRMARYLVGLMEARDADGYVFRTDLRLRPDPAATAPCLAVTGAISYYESMGQNWERAAMLKARPVAGDLALGAAFLDAIRPFVWRRHLDFAAVADIHAMKRRIDAHKGTGIGAQPDKVARILGHNVKLGQGGIREIEFLAQTLQLVWGGRDPALRTPRTLEALRLLARAGHIPRAAAVELAGAYRFLRRVEHRLQMVADRQTHALPDRRAGMEAFALFMGYRTARAFAGVLLRHLDRVRARYREVFETVPDADAGASPLDFTGVGEPPDETVSALTVMGYNNPAAIVEAVRSWQAGRIRALRSLRARELMGEVLPSLLAALSRQAQPDAAFARFDGFLGRLPTGVQLLSLFQRNPGLLDRVAAVLGAAPSLADHLARTPSALEGLLTPETLPDFARLLRARLADARALEEAIAIIRASVREEDFSISVATMEGRLDADAAGLVRASLADAALAALLARVLTDFAERYGRVRGGALALVLLGKAGGREMMAGSDLDLMLIYDHAKTAHESIGPRRLPASQWFIRAVHATIAALIAPDAEGPMFAVDMRLRPSGNKGPVAVSLAGFERYHAAEAWTWERMALTRARVIAGPAKLRGRVAAAITAALAAAGPEAKICADAAAMRARMLRDIPPAGPWDVKQRPGGQIEVEFIAQTLQLIHGRDHPALFSPTTRIALARLRDAGLLPEADGEMLIRADRLWRTVQGLLRITYGRAPAETLSQAASDSLLRAAVAAGADVVDMPGLHATLEATAQHVRAAFIRYVGEIET
jgi:glutamate-ammonia-ligase adenylyltransferase